MEDKNSSTNFQQRLMKEVVCLVRILKNSSSSHHFLRHFLPMHNVLRILGRGPHKSSQFEDSKTPLKCFEKLSEAEYIVHYFFKTKYSCFVKLLLGKFSSFSSLHKLFPTHGKSLVLVDPYHGMMDKY